MFEFRRLRSPLALLGMGAVGFALGAWNNHAGTAVAQTPAGPVVQAGATSDYSQRIVARIYGNIPVTREDLGEFLIARHGFNNVELLVNRRIIEHVCKQKNITVTDAEVEASFDEDLKPMNVDRATFVKHVLSKRGKTLYEWKEDVIRPGLLLKKLCQSDVKVSDEDLQKAFEAKYGEKVQCRVILWPDTEFRVAQRKWSELRNSEAEFAAAAAQQVDARLASIGGRIEPIGRGGALNPKLEEIAFRLKPGEVSELFPILDQKAIAVVKCDGRVPPVKDVSFEKEREKLHKEVFDKKVAQAIPAMFLKLKEEAKPEIFIPHGTTDPAVVRTKAEEDKLLKEDDRPVVPLPGAPKK